MRILIIEDHQMMVEGLRFILEQSYGDSLIFKHAKNRAEALFYLRDKNFDIILVDINLENENGIDLSEELLQKQPKLKIMILSMRREATVIERAKRVGVKGYVVKGEDSNILINGINEVINGGLFFSKEVQSILTKAAFSGETLKLTPREKEVLTLIAKEYTNEEIALELDLAKRTVDGHRQRMLEKFNARNTVGLIRSAMHLGLIE